MGKLRINREGSIKLRLSMLLLALSVVVAVESKSILAFLAMFASSVGDIMIMSSRGCCTGKKEKSFEYGIVSFATAHLFYICLMKTQISSYLLIIAFLLLVAIVFAVKNRDAASVLYAVVIILNGINSFFFHPLAFVGMLFFISSDIILAIFEDKHPWWQVPIWVTYVAAQICLLSSMLLI